MVIETKIDEKKHEIRINGEEDEIQKFLECIDETLTKNTFKAEIQKKIKELSETGEEQIIDFTRYHRIYFNKKQIIMMTDMENKKFYFSLIKQAYKGARISYGE
jgi:hypothetical protein